MKFKPTDKPLPPNWKYQIEMDFFRRPTWKERFQIAIGMCFRMTLKIASEHNPGKFQPTMDHKITKDIEAKPELEITPPV